MPLQTIHDEIHRLAKCLIAASRNFLIRADLAKQLFQNIDHRKRSRQTDRRHKVHPEARMQIMIIDVIVRQNRHLRVAGVVKRLAKQRTVMGQAAVTDVFSHTDRRLRWHILTTPKCCQRLADDNLRRETDIVVDILLSEADRLFPADRQRNCPDSLCLQRRRHNPAERVGGVRDQNRALLAVFHLKFNRIWIRKFVNLPGFLNVWSQRSRPAFISAARILLSACSRLVLQPLRHLPLLPPHVDRLQEGTHPDPQRSLYLALVKFQDQR